MRESGIPRDEFFVTTKIPCCPGNEFTNYSSNCNFRRDPAADIAHDFDMLGLDYVDLMLMHWPCDDPKETLSVYRAMETLVTKGKAKAVGVSNFNSSALAALLENDLQVAPAVDQCGYSIAGHFDSLWGRDDASRDACVAANCTFMACACSAIKPSGMLSFCRPFSLVHACLSSLRVTSADSPLGGWALGGTGHVLNDPTVRGIAAAHNRSAAQVALRWVVQQGVVAVTSSDNPDYVLEDINIFDFELTNAEMSTLSKIR